MEKVNILGIEYEIIKVPSISRDVYRVGEIHFERQEILILDTLSKDMAKVTLLHEVIHAILVNLGLTEDAGNENLVQGLAIALHQVIKDNKIISS
ncbi:MAG: Uncharacterized protein FD141_387 [Fusobacteria bacterium]|nr:MAG: Uncharacterized protein FD141_387 [Fusobacteriota bacterium]KAF0228948.1 MAG: hypothetical protein FD182_1204 [Fusobacteriota bacterium]